MKKVGYYIIYFYFKYIFINLLIFSGLIWISQIIRIIEFQYSLTFQIIDVAITTLFALPSFINPLMPFLLLIGSFILNYKLSSSNEIVVLKQYISKTKIRKISHTLILILFTLFFLNQEFISKFFYEKYKLKELEIRNNLKLGSPAQNEFHIDNIVSIFFENKNDGIFYEIEAIIYEENQFISSKTAEIEISKSNFNLVFNEGERLILNHEEKSKTIFDKFIYSLESKKYEELLMDKDHYNTIELLSHSEKDFINHGHNNIFQYLFILVICLISSKTNLFFRMKNNNTKNFLSIFIFALVIQILNSYLTYLLNGFQTININHYYAINITSLIIFYFYTNVTVK